MGLKLCFWLLACLFSQVGLRELPRMKSNCLPAVTHKHKCKMCGCSTQHRIHPSFSSSRPRARFTLTFMAKEWSSSYLRLFCFQKCLVQGELCSLPLSPTMSTPHGTHSLPPAHTECPAAGAEWGRVLILYHAIPCSAAAFLSTATSCPEKPQAHF